MSVVSSQTDQTVSHVIRSEQGKIRHVMGPDAFSEIRDARCHCFRPPQPRGKGKGHHPHY